MESVVREKRKNHGREVDTDVEDMKLIRIELRENWSYGGQVMNFRYVDELEKKNKQLKIFAWIGRIILLLH